MLISVVTPHSNEEGNLSCLPIQIMNILWMSWKDKSHPWYGGAEVVNEELAKRLVRDGHKVTFIVARFPGTKAEEDRDGFHIVRIGNRYSMYWHTFWLYHRRFRKWPDLVIDEMNIVPFFARFYVKKRTVMIIHQLCREIWFYQMFFPLNVIGYLLEPIYLRIISGSEVITISESTKRDLMRFGFRPTNIHIISEGIDIAPLPELTPKSFEKPMLLVMGRCEPMKRIAEVLKAFELVKKKTPTARLVIAGVGNGGEDVRHMREVSPYKDDIIITGPVSQEKKIELMREAAVLCMASVKEGWGLVVTEANSQGTPAVVYNVDGLRDSVKNRETGILCEINTPESMAENIMKLLENKEEYERLRENGWGWSKEINFEKSYSGLIEFIKSKC